MDGAKGGILLTWLIPIDLLDFDSIFNQTATLLLMAEIWRSPVEVGSTIYPSIYSFFLHIPGGVGFLPLTVPYRIFGVFLLCHM